MAVARFAVSFDEKLASAVRRAAGSERVSTWLADAALRKLRAQGIERVLEQWEAVHGKLSTKELKAARRKQRLATRR